MTGTGARRAPVLPALSIGHWGLGRHLCSGRWRLRDVAPDRSVLPAVALVLALLLVLLWPTQAWAQVPPPPAPTTGEIVEYYATDALGSTRVVFTASGAVVGRADYLPFGERFHTTGPLPSQQFTGQQRDPEAQLDHFNARSYQTTTGRFTGIDPVYAGLFDPQQWNRYGYARANPLKYVDPQGLETFRISVNCSDTFNVGCTQDPKAGTGPVGPSAWFLFGGMSPFGISYPERTLPLSFFTKGNHRPSRGDRTIGDGGANVVSPESPNGDTLSDTAIAKAEKKTQKSKWDELKNCAAAQYGFGAGETPTGLDFGRMVSEVGALPIPKSLVGVPVIGNSSRFTNAVSLIPHKLGIRLNTGVQILGSGRVFGALGRANVILGSAMLAWDVASIAVCTARE